MINFTHIEAPDMKECDLRPTVKRLENWLIWGDPEGFKDITRPKQKDERKNSDNR